MAYDEHSQGSANSQKHESIFFVVLIIFDEDCAIIVKHSLSLFE